MDSARRAPRAPRAHQRSLATPERSTAPRHRRPATTRASRRRTERCAHQAWSAIPATVWPATLAPRVFRPMHATSGPRVVRPVHPCASTRASRFRTARHAALRRASRDRVRARARPVRRARLNAATAEPTRRPAVRPDRGRAQVVPARARVPPTRRKRATPTVRRCVAQLAPGAPARARDRRSARRDSTSVREPRSRRAMRVANGKLRRLAPLVRAARVEAAGVPAPRSALSVLVRRSAVRGTATRAGSALRRALASTPGASTASAPPPAATG